MGIGGGILSEVFMNKRVETQKRELTRIIHEELTVKFSANSIETVERNSGCLHFNDSHNETDLFGLGKGEV